MLSLPVREVIQPVTRIPPNGMDHATAQRYTARRVDRRSPPALGVEQLYSPHLPYIMCMGVLPPRGNRGTAQWCQPAAQL